MIPALSLTSEEQYLLEVCRTALGVGDKPPDVAPDWARFTDTAFAQGAAPLAYLGLAECDAVPSRVLSDLQALYLGNTLRNRYLAQQLLELLEVFSQEGVLAVAYKGPLLAAWAYGDIGSRQVGDLDLVVRKADARRAHALMSALGFVQDNDAEVSDDAGDTGYHYAFQHPESRLIVEVHWSLMPRRFALDIALAPLWQRRVTQRLAGGYVETFSAEDSLLLLSLHGLKHAWRGLSHVCDVAAALRGTNPDITLTRARAKTLGCERALELALALAFDLLRIGPGPSADLRALTTRIYPSLFHSRKPTQTEVYLLWLRAREQPKHKLKLLYQLAHTLGYEAFGKLRRFAAQGTEPPLAR